MLTNHCTRRKEIPFSYLLLVTRNEIYAFLLLLSLSRPMYMNYVCLCFFFFLTVYMNYVSLNYP